MTYTLTQQLSHDELWESWDPTRTEDENGCHLLAFTPMGLASLRTMGEGRTWIIEVGWSFRKFSASTEEKAICIATECYRRTERAVVKAFIEGLKVNLEKIDEHGSVYAGGYTIRKGVELVDFPRNRESTEEIKTRDVYVLSLRGSELGKNTDYHVWEDEITAAFQYELLKALNLI